MNAPDSIVERESLYLCVGSACHQLGVFEVLPILEGLIRDHGLELTVALKGAFCLEYCCGGDRTAVPRPDLHPGQSSQRPQPFRG